MEKLLKHRILNPTSRDSDSVGLTWGLRNSNKLLWRWTTEQHWHGPDVLTVGLDSSSLEIHTPPSLSSSSHVKGSRTGRVHQDVLSHNPQDYTLGRKAFPNIQWTTICMVSCTSYVELTTDHSWFGSIVSPDLRSSTGSATSNETTYNETTFTTDINKS